MFTSGKPGEDYAHRHARALILVATVQGTAFIDDQPLMTAFVIVGESQPQPHTLARECAGLPPGRPYMIMRVGPCRDTPPQSPWDDPLCSEQDVTSALIFAAEDPRARPLLLQALETDDSRLVSIAISGLARQRDEAALPMIERALERQTDRDLFISSLRFYDPDAARALVEKDRPRR